LILRSVIKHVRDQNWAVHLDRLDGEFTLPAAERPALILKLMTDLEFQNVLVQKWTICNDLLNQVRQMKVSSRALLDLIDKEIGS